MVRAVVDRMSKVTAEDDGLITSLFVSDGAPPHWGAVLIRFVVSTPDNDVPYAQDMLLVGTVEDIREHIDGESQGDDDHIIEDVMYLGGDILPEYLGFDAH